MSKRSFSESFRDALNGLRFCLDTQRNLRIHLVVAILVLAASWWLRLDRLELALVVFAIGLVLVAEMFNTAVEKAIDLYTPTYHPMARLAKHIAAGAVLVAAISTVAIGALVLLPHLLVLR